MLAGNSVARLLGFVFYVAAARLLDPADYGFFAYALAIMTAASTLLNSAPIGLARFMSRSANEPQKQDVYFSNWIAVVGATLVVTIVLFLPLAPFTNLTGWMLAGMILNFVNVAVFETYLQALWGLGRFIVTGIFYCVANLVQLVAIVIVGALGKQSPELFFIIYGLSAIAALGVMQALAPTPISFRFGTVAIQRVQRIAGYMRPILLEGIFYSLWWGADLILVRRLLQPQASGNYAAAKTLAQVLLLAPTAIATASTPRLARLPEAEFRSYLVRILGLTAAVTLILNAGMVIVQWPLSHLVYGGRYPHVVDALPVLILGMALHGIYLIFAGAWTALGRPGISAVATGAGTAATIGLALPLITRLGLFGAALGFAGGAAAQLLIVGAYTLWGLYSGATVRLGHLPDESMLNATDL